MPSRSAPEGALETEVRSLRQRVDELERERATALEQHQRALAALKADKDRLSAVMASMHDEVWLADAGELQRQREWLRVTLASIGDAVLATDALGKIAFLNPAAAQLTGWTEQEALGRDAAEIFRVVDEKTHAAADDVIARVLSEKRTVMVAADAALLTRTGREIPIEDTAAPIRDAEGNICGVVVVFQDVTLKRRAQAELLAAHEATLVQKHRLSAVLEALPVGVALIDPQGGNIDSNQAFEKVWGGPRPRTRTVDDYIAYKAWWADTGRPVEPREWASARAITAGETVVNQEMEIERFDGSRAFVLNSAAPIYDAHDRIAGAAVAIRDITKVREAEAALRQSEERFRRLVEAYAQGVWETNAFGKVVSDSPSWRAYTGQSLEEWLNDGWPAAVHPDDRAHVEREWWDAVAAGRNVDIEFRLKCADGSWRWTNARAAAVRAKDGSILKWVGMNADIEPQKRAQEALAAAAQRLSAHFDNSPLAIIEFDPEFRVTRWSQEAESVFGWKAEEILGRAIAEMPWVHEEDAELVRQVSQAMLTGERQRNMIVNRNYRKDGSVIECEWYNSAIYDGAGRLASILSQVLDITERKRADEAIREAQKMESLGLLAGGVAHDFNNLLVGIVGNASLAQDLLPEDHPASELVEGVLKSGEQAAHLTRQMLAYSGKGRFLMEPLNLSIVIPEMVGLVQPSISKKITLHLDLAENLPPVEADRGQVQQVFMNLTLNAAEAIGSNEGAITVRTGVQQVDERFAQLHPEAKRLSPGAYVYLEVHDTGCGMDERTKAKIFDPFFSTKFTGRGLGLAAVAGIIRGHKGAIFVQSEPSKGSAFKVLLPAAPGAAIKPAAAPAREVLRGTGIVLVVDDEPIVRDMARRVLERYGYTVLVAAGGLEAIGIFSLRASEIALVILDLSMPQMSGEETLRELRKILPGAKVVISSGYNEADTMALLGGQHVSGFIQKPYTSSGLAERVKRSLA